MATPAATLVQSGEHDSVPFITVDRDQRGSLCWLVVGRDVACRCYSGERAMQIMLMLCKAKGIDAPD
jgi:hypothetical protein